MSIELFIKQLEDEFDRIPKGILTKDTDLRELDIWDSMHALILIVLIDSEYGVTLSGEDLRSISTVKDIYNIIQMKVKQT